MPEDQNIEWKENWRDDYLKWICGFANAQGGRIFIGLDDSGNVVGVADYARLLDRLGLIFGGKLKNVAVLLFHRKPEKLIAGCCGKIGRFTNESELLYTKYLTASISY